MAGSYIAPWMLRRPSGGDFFRLVRLSVASAEIRQGVTAALIRDLLILVRLIFFGYHLMFL